MIQRIRPCWEWSYENLDCSKNKTLKNLRLREHDKILEIFRPIIEKLSVACHGKHD